MRRLAIVLCVSLLTWGSVSLRGAAPTLGDVVTAAQSGTTATLAMSGVANGSVVIVGVSQSGSDADATYSVSDGVNTYVQWSTGIVRSTNPSSGLNSEACTFFVAHNVTGGNITPVVTVTNGPVAFAGIAVEVVGAATSSAINAEGGIGETSNSASHPMASPGLNTNSDIFMLGVAASSGNNASYAAASGFTSLSGEFASTTRTAQYISSSAGRTNETATWSNGTVTRSANCLIAIKAAASAPTTPGVSKLRMRFSSRVGVPVDPFPQPLITGPTANPAYNVSSSSVTISGVCNDNLGCTGISYLCSGASVCSGTDSTGPWDTWSFDVTLSAGDTTVTVTASDAQAQTADDAIVLSFAGTDSTAPSVTGQGDVSVSSSPQTITATATDAVGVVLPVTWSNAESGGAGSCTANAGTSTPISCDVTLTAGTNTLTIRACDEADNCGTDTVVVTLVAPLSIDQSSMPDGTTAVAYSRQLSASGGTGSKTWTNNGAGTTVNDSDSDCSGITISSAGLVEGTHTGTGECDFVAKVTDGASSTDTQAFTITFNASGTETSHQYFDTICDLPEAHLCASLRDNTQLSLAGYGNGLGIFHYYTGVAGDVDTYSDPQDAARLTWPVDLDSVAGGNNQMRIPITLATGEVLLGWDEWLGPEHRQQSCGGLRNQTVNYKWMQLTFSEGGTTDGSITIEPRHGYDAFVDCTDAANLDTRIYTGGVSGALIEGVKPADQPYQTTDGRGPGQGTIAIQSYNQKHSTWTRRIYRIKLNVAHSTFTSWNTYTGATVSATPSPGLYHEVSAWVCDEARACVREMYKAPIRRQNNWEAQGTVEFSGTAGTAIPLGQEITNGSHTYTTQFACSLSATSVTTGNCRSTGGGTVKVLVKVTEAGYGEEANRAVGTVMTVTSPPAGVNATATVTDSIGAEIRTGIATISFWLNTSSSHARATGMVTFTGTAGTSIAKNLQIRQNGQTYAVTDTTANIPAEGTLVRNIQALAGSAGPDANAPSGTVFTLVTPNPAITSIVASTDIAGGAYLQSGPLYSYHRNVWVLHNYSLPSTEEDDTTIFKKPVR